MRKRSMLPVMGCVALLLLAACGQQAKGRPDPPTAAAGQGEGASTAGASTAAPAAAQGEGTPAAGATPAGQAPTTIAAPEVSVVPVPTTVANTGEVPDQLLQAMIADLAGRIGVDPGSVGVRVSEAVTWPDGAMGCPQPGVAYTQALIDGYRVVLEAGGTEYAYHSSVDGTFLLCERPALRSRP